VCGERNLFIESYVTKNNEADGADAITAEPRPRYMPLHPPFWKKPPFAWSLVFMVSIGKNVRSVEVPAAAPLWWLLESRSFALDR
jgi:hypothetical protein